MKTRKSFLIRWLHSLDSNKNEMSIIDLEHVQSGDKWRLSSIEEAVEKMKSVAKTDASATPVVSAD